MNVPAVRVVRRSNVLATRDVQLKRDRDLQLNFQKIKDCRKDFEKLSEWLIENLDLPTNKKRAAFAKFLQKIVPGGWFEYTPDRLTRWVAEETDAADMVEGFLRQNINDVQEAVKNLAESAILEENRLREFVADIETAESEKWDAQTLQDYLSKAVELKIDPEVQKLLDEGFDILSPDDKEKRRLELINRLKGNAIGRKRVVEAHGKVCSLALQVFHTGACQYFDFVSIIRPLKVIHKAAEGMLDMNTSAYAAKEVVRKILQLSGEAFQYITEATAKVNEFAVTSPDTIALIEDTSRKLDSHLLKLEDARNKMLQLEDKQQEILIAAS